MRTIFTNWRVSVFGLLSWLVPFLASFVFFSPDTGLVIPLILFKSIMIVVGTLTGVALLVWVFRSVPPSLMSGVVIGAYWLVINWVLDLAVLVPMSGDDIPTWFGDIGLRYLSILIIATGMGLVGSAKRG